jgi:hypothetical protein
MVGGDNQLASLPEPIDECPEALSRKLPLGLIGNHGQRVVLLGIAMDERLIRPGVPVKEMCV